MTAGGYIRLFRQIQDHWTWNGEPACRGRAWADLLLLAAWEPHAVTIKGQPLNLERGDLVASVRFLAKRWGWSVKKTASFLARLEVDQMLARKRHGTGNGSASLFQIVNYELYQGDDGLEGNGSGNAQETVRRQSGYKTKKGKKGKKEEPPGNGLTFEEYVNQFNPGDQEVLRQTVQAIASTRRNGKVALTILNALALKFSRHPRQAVLQGCRTYLAKGYASQGKRENYLFGIIRNTAGQDGIHPGSLPKTGGQLAVERAVRETLQEHDAITGQTPHRSLA